MEDSMKAALLLSGSGVYDGSEIHEAVFCLLALAEEGFEVQAFAPDMHQLHVINHITGEAMNETRNVLIESARIVRGDIKNISELDTSEHDALVMPGGFGAAKNLSTWALDGPNAAIPSRVKEVIVSFIRAKKPILSLCISPVVIALALKGEEPGPILTLGTTEEKTPYNIPEINEALASIGAKTEMKKVTELLYDGPNKIITTPCYMQDTDITEIRNGISMAVKKLRAIVG
jgi:enhancing lycopene biosynthesis protein 2